MTDAPNLRADALKYEDWASEMGIRWLANLNGFEATIAPIGAALLEHARFSPDERVLDVGCGGGATTPAIAAAVLPEAPYDRLLSRFARMNAAFSRAFAPVHFLRLHRAELHLRQPTKYSSGIRMT